VVGGRWSVSSILGALRGGLIHEELVAELHRNKALPTAALRQPQRTD
jgi:uncharacterized protein (DUF433 family)